MINILAAVSFASVTAPNSHMQLKHIWIQAAAEQKNTVAVPSVATWWLALKVSIHTDVYVKKIQINMDK